MSIQLRKNLLIICEGTASEPNYLHDIRDKIIQKNIKYTIDIRPKPSKELPEDQFKLRPGAKKRLIRNPESEMPDKIVEDEYKAQPTRYVREAQIGLEDQTYDEAWAIFDRDQHPKTKEAFELADKAIKNKKVNVGFSNISFEVWILLHFELNKHSFQKTQCREGHEIFQCGTGNHERDCNGKECIVGYIKSKQYVDPKKNVKSTSFAELEDKTPIAIGNAFSLRKEAILKNPQTPLYELNPLTLIDRLVFKLLNLPINFIWIDLLDIKINKLPIFVNIDKNVLKIKIKNDNQTFILLPEHVALLNANGEIVNPLDRVILLPNEEKDFECNLNNLKNFKPIYIAFKQSIQDYCISELTLDLS